MVDCVGIGADRTTAAPALRVYRTCLFCHDDLGRNEVIEALPIGRRLAFDLERGRLWVVCRTCARWNLTPFEERWEALEQCERAFRGARLRASSDNVGLARLGDGVELVRIGAALRPELAAWRYGDQFGRRRRRQLLLGTGAGVALLAFGFGGPAAGVITGGAVQATHLALQLGLYLKDRRRIVTRLPVDGPDGRRLLPLAPVNVRRSRLRQGDGGRWELEVEYRGPGELQDRARLLVRGYPYTPPTARLTGESALRAAGRLLPLVNVGGGTRAQVADAVRVIEDAGDVERCFAAAAASPGSETRLGSRWSFSGAPKVEPGTIGAFAPAVRLALEMAAHEESERRALEGELAELARAWREAEEIAAIADELLVPDGTGARLAELRATGDRGRT